MKIDNSLIDKSKYENLILRRAGFESREDALQAAKNQRDRFEYTGIREGYACEQYNDLGAKLAKSGEVKFGISSSIKRDMLNCMEEYYRGECSDKELAEAYLKFCEQTGVGDKARLLDVYENFLNMSRYAANNVCSQKGNDITAKYGSVDEHDAVYYNSDFYYSFEKVKEITRAASEAVAETMDWGELDFA